ncbi:MAG TPA: hypothetical protein VM533_06990 [Fimbriiglobus sp.]|jgi:hypothetical protein|nr:hypothetical protein [Fimbriiglobus sp.]
MPVRAYVIAVRPYHKRLADDLWFSADRYASVPEGTTIVVPVFESVSSHTTDRLAGAFGIGIWDFARHELRAEAANIELLQEEFGWDRPESFMALRDAGFRFYFLPLHP